MKDLTQGGVTRNLFNFALPMFIGNIFQQLYNVTDSIIVGQIIGKEALGAVGASFPVIFILIAMIEGIGLGGTILIAQYYGAKQMDNVKKTVDTMYVFVFFASLVITAVGVLFSEQILILMQTPANVLPQAKSFLTITFYGMTFMVGYFSVAAALRGLGDSKTPLYFLIFSTFLNIGLVFLFVLGFKMGSSRFGFSDGYSSIGGVLLCRHLSEQDSSSSEAQCLQDAVRLGDIQTKHTDRITDRFAADFGRGRNDAADLHREPVRHQRDCGFHCSVADGQSGVYADNEPFVCTGDLYRTKPRRRKNRSCKTGIPFFGVAVRRDFAYHQSVIRFLR